MTQLISNLLMQPQTDAVEHPMTLIEKLEQKRGHHNHFLETCRNDRDKAYHSFGKKCYQEAINIVKQHSDWISVDERLPDKEQEVIAVLELTGFYVLAFFRNGIWYNADDGEQIARHKDKQAVTYWMPTPQPPSEVQDD